MELKNIYRPIKRELIEVEEVLRVALKNTKYKSILRINNYLLDAGGKKIRPMLVLLSAKATEQAPKARPQLTKIAVAIELIHRASLIHDDVVDHASLRHHKPTINSRWNQDVSIAFGDYLYSVAFELISECGNLDILRCISSATKMMCEGELLQVCERDSLDLLKRHYILLVKKKTAGLFAASCQAGVLISNPNRSFQTALRGYGLNFGIAFQLIDDCLDLISEKKDLGKYPGADFKMGELTLPILNLLTQSKDKNRIISLFRQQSCQEAFAELKQRFINSQALRDTKKDILFYIHKAKKSLNRLSDSCFKQSLSSLADYIVCRIKA